MSLLAGGAALALLALPSGAQAIGTEDFNCTITPQTASPIWAGSSTAQSFPANASGKLLTADLKGISRSGVGAGGDIAVELYGADGTGNLVAPLLDSTTIPSASVNTDGFSHVYTVNFTPATAEYLTAGQTYGIALRTTDTVQNAWDVNTTNPCANAQALGGGPPYGPLGGGAWDAGIRTYLGPENDDFARATTLIANPVNTTGTTAGGTREDPTEPDHYTIGPPGDPELWTGDHSVWYRWKALGTAPTTIDTCTAAIDSILGVYTGTDLASLTRVTDNNNACPSGFGSQVSFTADAGTTYDIAVGDAGGARENTFTLNIDGPPNEAPTITNQKPAPGAKISKRKPVIKATVADSASELASGDVALTLDGRERANATYDAATDKIKFRKKLKPGRHEVEVKGTDEQSLTGTESWSFKIRR